MEGPPTRFVRFLLAAVFVGAGALKLLHDDHASAFRLQLDTAGLPYPDVIEMILPFVEIGLGVLLALNLGTRAAAVGVMAIMVAAIYTHANASPKAFPSQPQEPYVPLVVLGLSLFLLWRKSARAGS